jgi:hypothetical protein
MKQKTLLMAVLFLVGCPFLVPAQNPKGQGSGKGELNGVTKAHAAENTLPPTQVAYGNLSPSAKQSLPMPSLYGASTHGSTQNAAGGQGNVASSKTLDPVSQERLNLTTAPATEDAVPAGLRLESPAKD